MEERERIRRTFFFESPLPLTGSVEHNADDEEEAEEAEAAARPPPSPTPPAEEEDEEDEDEDDDRRVLALRNPNGCRRPPPRC